MPPQHQKTRAPSECSSIVSADTSSIASSETLSITSSSEYSTDGSLNSGSDVSQCSLETFFAAKKHFRRRSRKQSITSVSTIPSEEAYVMVLQNRQRVNEDVKCAGYRKELCDVTFITGNDKQPVHGIRAIIGSHSRLLHEIILSHQYNINKQKHKQSKLRTTLSKLACVGVRSGSDTIPKLIVPIQSFDFESFQRFMTYIHCGTLTVDASTVIGLLNAAYMFDMPEVQQACWDFAIGCVVRADNRHDMIRSLGQYINHKMTHVLMKTLEKHLSDLPDILQHSQTLTDLMKHVSLQNNNYENT